MFESKKEALYKRTEMSAGMLSPIYILLCGDGEQVIKGPKENRAENGGKKEELKS